MSLVSYCTYRLIYCKQTRAKRSQRQQQTNTAEYLNAAYEEAESPRYQSWEPGAATIHAQVKEDAESNTSVSSDRELLRHRDGPQSSTVLISEAPPSYYSQIGAQPPPTQPLSTHLPPTHLPPTQLPPTQLPPTQLPPTHLPPTQLPPAHLPPTQPPSTQLPPTRPPAYKADSGFQPMAVAQ